MSKFMLVRIQRIFLDVQSGRLICSLDYESLVDSLPIASLAGSSFTRFDSREFS
jgi:hypothetical protein